MPSLLKRISFRVAGTNNERTFTLSSVSDDGHFISLRPLIKPAGEKEVEFPFEWAFAGTNKDVDVTKVDETNVRQVFRMAFDSNVYLKVPNASSDPVDTNWKTWDSGVLQESGTIFPFGDDRAVEFEEIWQPIDIESGKLILTDSAAANGRSIVLKVTNSNKYGIIIVTGKWIQGLLGDLDDSSIKGLNFIRFVQNSDGSHQKLINYGSNVDQFPTKFDSLEKGETIDVNGVSWEVLEYHV
ncbi:hypothetical protein KAFR_0A04760 [Kazachstania africana CBS 2517]|uniref:Protein HRI1 n=1 Tax=Kazachstania africana (strain ATCC 22294 / BCRC 22015 / CBS 2517 / CECT 1963 / NBRC 1671 / NRRL Y-8276) TaxID=1071382 RepID=H2ANG1_KAZAF|nr:hypothetical protein KAFR_0A04760 [Kazachstania africana CBS 2517]CCF55911.1 hypothetical protein KAFR_0A04760 [Kazachstania africana CBS 2517]